MNLRPVILVIDDRSELPEICRAGFGDRVDIRWAQTVDEARRLFAAAGTPAAIVLDGYLAHETTVELAKEFREAFQGPMIAASSSQRMNNELVQAGCSQAARHKRDVVEMLNDLLPRVEE